MNVNKREITLQEHDSKAKVAPPRKISTWPYLALCVNQLAVGGSWDGSVAVKLWEYGRGCTTANINPSHSRKMLAVFPCPARMSLNKLLARESLVSDIPAGDGKTANLFLIVHHFKWTVAWDGVFAHCILSRIERKDLAFFSCCANIYWVRVIFNSFSA